MLNMLSIFDGGSSRIDSWLPKQPKVIVFWFVCLFLNHAQYVPVLVTQSCPALCKLPDSFVFGILQARKLEWIAIPFSKGSSRPRD